VLGAGGFIGSHMVKRLKGEGYWVSGVDLKEPEFSPSQADEFSLMDLRDPGLVNNALSCKITNSTFDAVYQFAADMGGAGFVFSGEHDADIMHNSATINLNVLDSQQRLNSRLGVNKTKLFYSSSACMYPEHNQLEPENPDCKESSAYPANPDSEYGWEKLFSERLFLSYHRNYKLQTRSFLFIDECIEATWRLMQSNFSEPINIGSEEMVTINQLIETVSVIAGKRVAKKYNLEAPTGVRGRNSSNELIRRELGWDYRMTLKQGLEKTYNWINEQIEQAQKTTLSLQ